MTERLWLGNDGTYQVVASYVCLFKDKKVKLRKENGSVIAIPLSLLCEEDIAFIATQSGQLETNATFRETNDRLESTTVNLPSSFENTSPTTDVLRHIPTSSENQHVRHMTLEESKKMLPSLTLSSITERFKRQTFIEGPLSDSMNLSYLPRRIIGRLFGMLDTNSRAQLARVNHRFHPFIFKPTTWETLWFIQQQNVMIDDIYLYKLILFLRRFELNKAVKRVYLDETDVTSCSVLFIVQHLENVEILSIQSCWRLFTYQLAIDLIDLAKNTKHCPLKLTRVIIGKVLNRGILQESKDLLESKSFGQDVWIINSALNRLVNRNVSFDVALCNTCNIGASAYEFLCMSCGILPLLKCAGCAPRCDRCGNRSCQLPTCVDPTKKVEITKCNRCHSALALCNTDNIDCQRAREQCDTCQGIYHLRCRSSDGMYFSNQCSGCGQVACPYCQLTVCGGCEGQWCKSCASGISHCKCILIHSDSENPHKKISKRNVCRDCQKVCSHCGARYFCDCCLQVHFKKCI